MINVEELIRPDHPLRPIKAMVDRELSAMSRSFSEAYGNVGRPSIPPETLLKAMLLQALYSIRSERQLVERIGTDLMFRWFLDLSPEATVFHHTVFSHNRERLDEHGLVQRFFDGVVRQAMNAGLTSDDHFTVDGTLIRSHASLKSLKPIDDDDDTDPPSPTSGGRNASVDFRGKKRRNATHRSMTDPEARLYRKGDGQPAYLSHTGHVISENRHGLIMAVAVDEANGKAERKQALKMLDHLRRKHRIRPATLGADKGYDSGDFLRDLVDRSVVPHVAIRSGPIRGLTEQAAYRRAARLQQRHRGQRLSQRRRKLVEEGIGWMKTVGGLARSSVVGRWKIRQRFTMAAAAYNLVRMVRLCPT
ncbi:MAG: IS5 family transposase [Sulfuricella denitrificans]|nr:IS5 family transposase [Sulfuricella denitrificans]